MKRPRKERNRYTSNIDGSSLAAGQLSNLHPSGWGHIPQALLRYNEFHPGATYQIPLKLKEGQLRQRYKTLPLVITPADRAIYAVITQYGKFEEDGQFVARGLRVLRIAERAGVSKRRVRPSRMRLEAAGFISTTRGTGPFTYTVLPTAKIPTKAERDAASEDVRKQGGRPPNRRTQETPLNKGGPQRAPRGDKTDTTLVSEIAPLHKTFLQDLSTQTGEVVEENPEPEPQPFRDEELEAQWRDKTLNEEAQTRYDRFIEAEGVITTTHQAYKDGIRRKLIEEDWFTETYLPAYRSQQALTQLEECPNCNDAGFILDEHDEPALFNWIGESGARPMKCQHAGPEANEAYVENERAKAAEESWSPRYPISEDGF